MTNFIVEKTHASGLPLDEEALARLRAASPPLPYAILFTARSGSTFLTHALMNTGRFGRPHEWFNPETVGTIATEGGFASVDDYIRHVWKQETSTNGVFGIEMNWYQFSTLLEIVEFEACFRNQVIWFFLRRRNLVAQAVSLHIAEQTRIFHSYQIERGAPPANNATYDGEGIMDAVSMLLIEEKRISDYYMANGITPIELFYEDMVTDPARTLGLFCNALRVRRSVMEGSRPNPIKKIGGAVNDDFETRFRRDHASFLDAALESRPMLGHPVRII